MRQLAQTFLFPGASAERLAQVLASAPLVGERSIFGPRNVSSTSSDDGVRRAVGFEPAPFALMRFDVELRQRDHERGTLVLVEISQPQRRRPYLAGQFTWLLTDSTDAAVLREEINTPAALEIVSRPLDGSRPSVRRWLFFAVGHRQVMREVATNLRALLASESDDGD